MTGKKEIIDNETHGYDMAEFLNDNIPKYHTVDIATGFFNIGGYDQVQQALDNMILKKNSQFRLLFGKENMSDLEPSQKDYENTMVGELDSFQINADKKKLAESLITFLERDNVFVKNNTSEFTHAKCYIFDKDAAVVGSSNFTRSGLKHNIELNAALYQPSSVQLVQEWFERRWNKSTDAKNKLIKLVEESKFGMPLDPYLLYMKMLYEYYRQRIEDNEKMKGKNVELTRFQHEAVTEAKRILRKYGGVMIADSTGLGKTHIGIELLRSLVMEERQKILLIAPAQVVQTVWEPRLLEESIKTKNIHVQYMGQKGFDPSQYIDFDIVIIDESHNLRSRGAKQRINTMKILAGGANPKKVILMSATPINNSLMDLYYQLSLLTAGKGDDLFFANLDIADLYTHFIRATNKKGVREGIDSIVRILDEIMIKRTRTFIKENYDDATLNGIKIQFPKRNLHKVEYSLTELYGTNVYSSVIDTLDNMHLVPYRLDEYNKNADEDTKKRAAQISTLQKIILAKRFESSINAIRASIKKLDDLYTYFEKAITVGKILNSKKLNKVIDEVHNNDENNEAPIAEFLQSKELDLEPLGSNYDKKQLLSDLKSDKKKIQELAGKLEQIKPYGDTKLSKLHEDLIKHKVFEKGSKKIVIFTSYVDTAEYVYENLKSTLTDKRVLLLTGNVSLNKRKEILEQFSPKSNHVGRIIPDDLEEADVLVTTEVLSEGQNLQDCNYVINYDLPWNPMRIVQRVGRVDRLTSEYPEITSAVFIPEKQLNDLLKIMEKLESKIQTIGSVVGAEASILGEKENPKDFNALDRIKSEDASLIDDIERSADLFTMDTPYQEILQYISDIGADKLCDIKFGRRSGRSSDYSGAVMMYIEKKSKDTHLVLYDHKKTSIISINDIAESFTRIRCGPNEKLSIPFDGNKSFNYMKMINDHAVKEILDKVNISSVQKSGSSIGGKYQRLVKEKIILGYKDKTISKEDVGNTYDILNSRSLNAWEIDLKDIINRHNVTHDTMRLLKDVQSLIAIFRIEKKPKESMREVKREDLQIVGCMILDGPDMKDKNIDVM